MRYTNVSDDDAAMFYLARRGYGSLADLQEWDTPQLLDVMEYEHIQSDIEHYHIQQAQNV